MKVHQLVTDLGRLDGEEEKLSTYDKLLVEVQNALQIAHDDLSVETVSCGCGVYVVCVCVYGVYVWVCIFMMWVVYVWLRGLCM